MVLKRLAIIFYKKCYVAKYQKIEINRFKSSLSDKVTIIGESLDEYVLNAINSKFFEFTKIKEFEIITTYSNLDKKFFSNWSGLSKFLGLNEIKLKMKILYKPIPPDIYVVTTSAIFLIPKFCFEREITEVCIYDNPQEKEKIVQSIESAEDISHLQGTLAYNKKFDKIFEITKRNFSLDESDKIINALISWEISGNGYDDIEPLWRIFEEKIRRFMKSRLERKDPISWFSKLFYGVLPSKKQQLIINSFDQVKKYHGITQIDSHPSALELVNPGDYKIVIEKNRSIFPEFFSNVGERHLFDLEDIVKIRNITIHPKASDPPVITSNAIIKSLILIEFLNQIEPSIK